MQKARFSTLLQELTYEDQKKILMAYYGWIIHQQLVEVKKGISPLPEGGGDEIRNMDPSFEDRLDEAVKNRDKGGILKIGLSDVFRGMRIMQNETTGPQLNAFFNRTLPHDLFEKWYQAAGLDTNNLSYDFDFSDFPVDDL